MPATPVSPTVARPGRRRLLFVAVALVVSLLLTLLELALRVYDPLQHPLVSLRGFYRLDAAGRVETAPGWHGRQSVEGRWVEVRTNQLGLRGPELGERVAGERRVLMLGDSYVWGMGVDEQATIPAVLQQRLLARAAGPVTVGNAGMYGTGPREWAYTLARFDGSFRPDVVVAVMYVGNDLLDTLLEPLSVVDGWLLSEGLASAARSSLRFRLTVTFRTWYHLEQLLHGVDLMALAAPQQLLPAGLPALEAPFLDLDPRFDAEVPFVGEVERRLAVCFREFAAAAQGLPTLVVLLPGHEVALRPYVEVLAKSKLDPALHQRGNGHARLQRLLAAAGLPVLDLAEPILGDGNRAALYFAVDWHFSPAGCKRVAEWLEPEVAARLPARRP